MAFYCDEVSKEWLQESLVGRVKEPKRFIRVKYSLILEGLSSFRLWYLGDNLVLLKRKEGEQLNSIIEENQEWLTNFFEEIKPWCSNVTLGARLAWVRTTGLPLNLRTISGK